MFTNADVHLWAYRILGNRHTERKKDNNVPPKIKNTFLTSYLGVHQ